MDEPLAVLKTGLARQFETSKFSDVTIICGPYQFKVHKAIICAQSDYFDAAGSALGGSSNVIKLKAVGEEGGGDDEVGDDPEAIRSMVHFFYHLDYNVDKSSSPVSKGKRKKVDRGSLPGASQEPSLAVDTDTVKHANVFAAAVKYDVPALRRLAVSKFKAAARKDWADPSFAEAAHIAYTTTADDVRDLRDIVGTTINGHQQLLDRPGMEGVLRSNTDLMLELLRMASGLPAIAETGSDDSDLCESCGASLVPG